MKIRKKKNHMMTTGEIARLVGVASRTVSQWVDSGSLPGSRIPGCKKRLIHRDRLESFLLEHFPDLTEPVSPGTAVDGSVVVEATKPECLMRCDCQCTFRAPFVRVSWMVREPKIMPLRCPACREV